MRSLILLTFLLHLNLCFSKCQFENLTDQSVHEKRQEVFNNLDNTGVRLAWQGMKEMNSLYLSGTVDAVTSNFEATLCEKIESAEVRRSYPGANIEIKKMDFKGYYITCHPKKNCLGFDIESQLNKISPPEFPKTREVPEPKKFYFVTALAENYQEGYIRARIKGGYPGYDGRNPPLHLFIENQLDLAISEAFGIVDLSEVDILEPKIREELSHNLSLFRGGDDERKFMNPKYKKLALALDVLMETPYADSNNFEAELKTCIKGPEKKIIGVSFCTAQSGDDMNIFVRKDGKVTKVVAVDAKGLGTLNMMSRLDEYMDLKQDAPRLTNMEKVFSLSITAIRKADEQMKLSMETYVSNLKKTIAERAAFTMDLDQALRMSHETYHTGVKNNSKLMQMRAGVIELCGDDTKCLLNRMTVIHNNLKLLEKKGTDGELGKKLGIDGHFGDSCVGTEYWVRAYKAKGILEVSP